VNARSDDVVVRYGGERIDPKGTEDKQRLSARNPRFIGIQ
jgi:hypothetical protein